MIETHISILINRKPDFGKVKKQIINHKLDIPVFILEYEHCYRLNFTSDYEEWELDNKLLECFPRYEFTDNLEKGKKEIRLLISRYQDHLSTDNWGRPIESPIDENKYLVKKTKKKLERFNPNIKVLFEDNEQSYFVNIVEGISSPSGNEGYLILKEFKTKDFGKDITFFKDHLYKTPLEAFISGFNKMRGLVENDFKEYNENKKKEKRRKQRLPRKIIRDFIK